MSTVGLWASLSISEIKKAEDNLYDPESANTIHIGKFGKLVPDKARMTKVREHVARVRKSKQDNDIQED